METDVDTDISTDLFPDVVGTKIAPWVGKIWLIKNEICCINIRYYWTFLESMAL